MLIFVGLVELERTSDPIASSLYAGDIADPIICKIVVAINLMRLSCQDF